MNFTVQPLKFFWTLQEIIELHLVPGYFNPFILIKGSVPAKTITEKKKDINPLNEELQEAHYSKFWKGYAERKSHTLSWKLLCQEFHCTAKLKQRKNRIQSMENEEDKETELRKTRKFSILVIYPSISTSRINFYKFTITRFNFCITIHASISLRELLPCFPLSSVPCSSITSAAYQRGKN